MIFLGKLQENFRLGKEVIASIVDNKMASV